MTVNEKILYIFGSLFLSAALVIYACTVFFPVRVTNSVYRSNPSRLSDRIDKINQIYTCEFMLENIETDFLPSFVPNYNFETSPETIIETDEKSLEKTAEISGEEAVKEAKRFINEKNLPLKYSEILLAETEFGYSVKFLSELAGLINHARPICITLDIYGNILTLYHFIPEYEKLGSTRIITMKEAFYNLPTEGNEGLKIELKKCELVYFYDDSIIQPAYMFEGEIADGGKFESFIKASKY